MTAFGSAIGLSLLSPYQGPSPKLFYIVLALWFTWITVSCFAAGGYVTGRMRRPIDGSTTHEVHVRDGAHGLVVWAVVVVVSTSLATLSLSSAVKGGADLAKSRAATASSVAPNADPIGYSVDNLLRGDGSASAGNGGTMETSRQEVSRILSAAAANGSLSSDDRAYLVRVVAARTGLAQVDAGKRVDAISAQMKAVADKAREAAETARKAGIILAFLNANPIDYGVDNLLRGEGSASAGNSGAMETSRLEVSRILAMGAAKGSLGSDDRAYLVRVVAARTGLAQTDAEKRVDAISAQMKAEADKAREATETARKAGIILAFLTAATMVLGVAAAWWGGRLVGCLRLFNGDFAQNDGKSDVTP